MKSPSQQSRKAMTARVAIELPHSNYEKFGEILGFLDGDGCISKKKEISFYNSELFCIKKILDNFSDVFGIDIERFYYYLTVPFQGDSHKITDKWRGYLRIKKRVMTYVDKRKRIKKRYGGMRVSFYNDAISKKILNEIDRIKSGKEKNSAILLGYLRGFFAAEGAVVPGKMRRVIPNSIQFPQKGKETPEAIKGILDKFGIEGRVVLKHKKADYYCVNITGHDNFKKFDDLGLSCLHPEKKEKIRKGLDSYGKIVSRKLVLPIKLLKVLEKRPMTRAQIYALMDSYPQKINGMLYSKTSYLVKNKLLVRKNDDNEILWRITREGCEFLRRQE